MGLDSYVARQVSNPSGRFAPLVARLLNSGNRALNREAIAALDLREAWRVLEAVGVLAVAMRSQQALAHAHLERFGFRNVGAAELERLLATAGFSAVGVREVAGGMGGGAVVVRAVKAQGQGQG